MTTLTNPCEGSDGVAVTTSNAGGGGSNWDVVDAGAGATIAYSTTHFAHGTSSIQFATGGTAADFALKWTSASFSAAGEVWYRLYGYFTANPGTSFPLFSADTTGGAAQCAAIVLGTDGTLAIQDGGFGTIATTANAIPLNQWWRIDGFVIGSATVGQVSLSLYNSMDSTTATETQTTSAAQNTSGNVGQVFWGGFSRANIGPFWADDLGFSTTGALGPAATFMPAPGLNLSQAVKTASSIF